MSQASWHGDGLEHDFYEEEPHFDDVPIPSSYIDDRRPSTEVDGDEDAAMSLELEIKKLELQKLELLSSQRRRQGGQHVLQRDTIMRTDDSEQRSRRRQLERQQLEQRQQMEVPEREHRGK